MLKDLPLTQSDDTIQGMLYMTVEYTSLSSSVVGQEAATKEEKEEQMESMIDELVEVLCPDGPAASGSAMQQLGRDVIISLSPPQRTKRRNPGLAGKSDSGVGWVADASSTSASQSEVTSPQETRDSAKGLSLMDLDFTLRSIAATSMRRSQDAFIAGVDMSMPALVGMERTAADDSDCETVVSEKEDEDGFLTVRRSRSGISRSSSSESGNINLPSVSLEDTKNTSSIQAVRASSSAKISAMPTSSTSSRRNRSAREVAGGSLEETGVLTVTNLRCFGLINATYLFVPYPINPFVSVRVGSHKKESKFQTGQLDPVFDESFNILVKNAGERDIVVVEVLDRLQLLYMEVRDRRIGSVSVPLAEVIAARPHEVAKKVPLAEGGYLSFRMSWSTAKHGKKFGISGKG